LGGLGFHREDAHNEWGNRRKDTYGQAMT
jgi:hypothetical protein